jgi:hypothetical protein
MSIPILKIIFFLSHRFPKILVFRDFPTLDGSDFYSISRGDLDTPLYISKNFGLGKGVPLRETVQ